MIKTALVLGLMVGMVAAQPVTFPAVGTFMLTTNSITNGAAYSKDRTINIYYGELTLFKGTNNGVVHQQASNFVGRVETRREMFNGKEWVPVPIHVPPSLPPGSPGGPLPQNPNPFRIE